MFRAWFLAACCLSQTVSASEQFIIVQSTTSTKNSGLLDHLVPKLGDKTGIDVRVVAVGTGQALKNSRNGDGDVLLVHAKPAEERFVAMVMALSVSISCITILSSWVQSWIQLRLMAQKMLLKHLRKSRALNPSSHLVVMTRARTRKNLLCGAMQISTSMRARGVGIERQVLGWARP